MCSAVQIVVLRAGKPKGRMLKAGEHPRVNSVMNSISLVCRNSGPRRPRGSPESRTTEGESVTCDFHEDLFCRAGAWSSLPYDTGAATVTLLGPESDKNGAHNY